jgi:cobalamin-dependent methionine synthase I
VGEAVSSRISALFEQRELVTGFLLNAVASEAADALAALTGRRYLERLAGEGRASRPTRVLGYSPGYCGWHLSGQGALFARLRPEEIGITLSTSYLMQPLKSVSGVLVAGAPEMHAFGPDFPFCEQCTTRSCEARIAAVFAG